MGFENLELQLSYRSDKDNVYKDFFEKCIKESISYDRAVGYFTSGSLKLMSKGLEEFLFNGGTIRIITSPNFSSEDLEAIMAGEDLKKIIDEKILKEWEIFSKEIENSTLEVFSWLVATEKLKIKIAYQNDFLGIYHEKFGLFTDNNNNIISFTGSINETVGGMKNNFESIDVYTSLLGEREILRINEKKEDFEKLWNNCTNKINVVDISEAITEKILIHKPESLDALKKKILDRANEAELPLKKPNWLEIRNYQEEAFNLWKNNKFRGILEMATGTGKTITALNMMVEILKIAVKQNRQIFFVILCPQKFLQKQWGEEVENFGANAVLCSSDNPKWKEQIQNEIKYYENSIIKSFVAIVTNDTFIGDRFQNIIRKYTEKNMILIVDECHNLGSKTFQELLQRDEIKKIKYRLGLSATPERHQDIKGNNAINEFLGDIIYRFSMDEAIQKGILTKYDYKIQFVKLKEKEYIEYCILTEKIKKSLISNNENEQNEYLEMLLFNRARIVKNAEEKMEKLFEIIRTEKEIKRTLIYVGAGVNDKEDDLKIVDKITNGLNNELKIKAKKFTAEENAEDRKCIINEFKADYLDAIVAIKCLDEGINIPSIEKAFILASSTDPREYIQRRGRVLRKYPGKEKAIIYDFIVIPQGYSENGVIAIDEDEKKLLKKELLRVKEFARLADNYSEILEKTKLIQEQYSLFIL